MNSKTLSKTKKITFSALLAALGIIIPYVFHFFGPGAGMMFLPMHFSVLIAGLLLGSIPGISVAVISIFASTIITGGMMPPMVMLPFMLVELLIYGFVTGIFSNKSMKNIKFLYIGLITAMVVGRIVKAIVMYFLCNLLHISQLPAVVVWTDTLSGIPGMILQIILIPPLIILIEKVIRFDRAIS
ncbi:MAG: ECF transporter S component [Bacillota bacterium]|nr:ECF transporter S component [Bacillota bacterium]